MTRWVALCGMLVALPLAGLGAAGCQGDAPTPSIAPGGDAGKEGGEGGAAADAADAGDAGGGGDGSGDGGKHNAEHGPLVETQAPPAA